MLTIHDRRKKREGLDATDVICKALGWYFPLLAKLGVKSVEELCLGSSRTFALIAD